jgi:hypothetical protein
MAALLLVSKVLYVPIPITGMVSPVEGIVLLIIAGYLHGSI